MNKTKKRIGPGLALILLICLAFGIWRWYDSSVDRSGWEETGEGLRYRDFHGAYVYGWQDIDGKRYYFDDNGHPVTGWIDIGGKTYCFRPDGTMRTGWVDGRYLMEEGTPASGWLEDGGCRYYLTDNGTPITGWNVIDGTNYYFQEGGAMLTGWAEFSGVRSYFTADGLMVMGWQEIDGSLYYFSDDGAMVTGWLELGEYRYYLHPDGKAAAGPTEIDGETLYFTPKGIQVTLVNPWHSMPEDYHVTLAKTTDGHFVDKICVAALEQMLSDCAAAGYSPVLASSYREWSHQEYLYDRKVRFWMEEGYEPEEAKKKAGTSVAVPGTSEHQLGLAVDIVDSHYTLLDAEQAETATQQWLMEHCWEYGFILRYLDGTSDMTGIIFEPWHYRYVGREVSMDMRDSGLCLEEYLGAVHQE